MTLFKLTVNYYLIIKLFYYNTCSIIYSGLVIISMPAPFRLHAHLLVFHIITALRSSLTILFLICMDLKQRISGPLKLKQGSYLNFNFGKNNCPRRSYALRDLSTEVLAYGISLNYILIFKSGLFWA